jgi:hypothetical protein
MAEKLRVGSKIYLSASSIEDFDDLSFKIAELISAYPFHKLNATAEWKWFASVSYECLESHKLSAKEINDWADFVTLIQDREPIGETDFSCRVELVVEKKDKFAKSFLENHQLDLFDSKEIDEKFKVEVQGNLIDMRMAK